MTRSESEAPSGRNIAWHESIVCTPGGKKQHSVLFVYGTRGVVSNWLQYYDNVVLENYLYLQKLRFLIHFF